MQRQNVQLEHAGLPALTCDYAARPVAERPTPDEGLITPGWHLGSLTTTCTVSQQRHRLRELTLKASSRPSSVRAPVTRACRISWGVPRPSLLKPVKWMAVLVRTLTVSSAAAAFARFALTAGTAWQVSQEHVVAVSIDHKALTLCTRLLSPKA